VRRRAAPRQSSAPILAIIASLALLGFGAFAGWRALSNSSNAIDQAKKFLAACKSFDWTGMRMLVIDPQPINEGEQEFESLPVDEDQLRAVSARLEFRIGDPVYEGETATIPVAVSMRGGGNDQASSLTMKRVNGIWKVDQDHADVLQAASKAIAGAIMRGPLAAPSAGGAGQRM
jgi:hypothetical protein